MQKFLTRKTVTTGVLAGLLVVFCLILLDQFHARSDNTDPPASSLAEAPYEQPVQKPFEFPKGGRDILPSYRLVALYGAPDTPALGSLGEQPLADAITRASTLAAAYQPYSAEPVYPAFEIIASVAAAEPTDNGDYSRETSVEKLRPWIEAAKEAGIYVLLDLQPGLTDFPTQAKFYEPLLKEPHVGLALDPEWRLKPGQKHMKQIGSVSAAEVNRTASWLADLVQTDGLPQKLFLLHQFKRSMITERETLDTSRAELAWLIQMDGLGNQNVKQDTWRNITADPPAHTFFGWKNFIDEDKPMLSPEQTMTTVLPAPWYVSYQ